MKKALIGAGGHAREVMAQIGMELPCFVDDKYVETGSSALGLSLFDPTEFEVIVAIGDSHVRKSVVDNLPLETVYFSFIHKTATVFERGSLDGRGIFVGAYCFISTNVAIGEHALFNRHVQIGHDCRIGDFFSAMPGVIISGSVLISDCVYIGSGAIVRESTKICQNVKIGMNCGVLSDISIPGTYVGTPARPIKK
jgi:sugar O-acyltransferase (sialic acid O-acetyltransferase NeuD family)